MRPFGIAADVVENIGALQGRPLTGHYDGYASCPITSSPVAAGEFDYDFRATAVGFLCSIRSRRWRSLVREEVRPAVAVLEPDAQGPGLTPRLCRETDTRAAASRVPRPGCRFSRVSGLHVLLSARLGDRSDDVLGPQRLQVTTVTDPGSDAVPGPAPRNSAVEQRVRPGGAGRPAVLHEVDAVCRPVRGAPAGSGRRC